MHMTQITTVQTVLLTFHRIQSSYWNRNFRILLFRMQAKKNYNLQFSGKQKIHAEKVSEYMY